MTQPPIMHHLIHHPSLAMHLSEGILPASWSIAWWLLMIPFLMLGIRSLKQKSAQNRQFKPVLGLIGACVLIISCMPVPIPMTGTCSHPCGTGLAAIIVGPCLTVVISSIALLFQALFLAHGGLTTLGANVVSMGLVGGFVGFSLFAIARKCSASLALAAFMAGLGSDWATYAATSLELALAIHGSEPIMKVFYQLILAFAPTQIPLGIIEGLFSAGFIRFIHVRRPDLLEHLRLIPRSSAIPHSTPQ